MSQPGLAARMLSFLIRGYQLLRGNRPSPCRFTPSCSVYALEAIASHGALRGAWLGTRRLFRCHPWGGQGWDPVPERTGTVPSAADRNVA